MVKRLLLFLCLLPCHMATAAMTPGPYRCTAESGQVFLLLEKGEDGWRGTVGENRLVDAVLRQVPGGPPGTATFAMAGNNIPGRATLSLREAVPTPSATPGISNSAAVSPSAGVSGSAPSPPVAAAVTPPRPTGLTGQATVFHKDGSLDETFQVACAPLAGDIREALDPATSFRLCQAALRDITQAIGAAYAKDGTVFTDMPSLWHSGTLDPVTQLNAQQSCRGWSLDGRPAKPLPDYLLKTTPWHRSLTGCTLTMTTANTAPSFSGDCPKDAP